MSRRDMTRREELLAMAADVESDFPDHAATLRFWASQLREEDPLHNSRVREIHAQGKKLRDENPGMTQLKAARTIAPDWKRFGFEESKVFNIVRGNHPAFRK
jgi:hypothetical protein